MYYDVPEGLGLKKIASDAKAKPTGIYPQRRAGSYNQSSGKKRYLRALRGLAFNKNPDYIDRGIASGIGMGIEGIEGIDSIPRAQETPKPAGNRNIDGRWAKLRAEQRRLRAEQRRLRATPKATTLGQLGNINAREWWEGVKSFPSRALDFRDASGKSQIQPILERNYGHLKHLPDVTLNDIRNHNAERSAGLRERGKLLGKVLFAPNRALK